MIKLALMIEGQDGLNWRGWKKIVRAAEELGFSGLFRSDHFTNPSPPEKDSLELWTSLTWLAENSELLEFGPLVAPVSFRHPVFIARMGREVDDLSGGRLTLGIGAGWLRREHAMFGFELLSLKERMDRLSEGVEVVARLLRATGECPSPAATIGWTKPSSFPGRAVRGARPCSSAGTGGSGRSHWPHAGRMNGTRWA